MSDIPTTAPHTPRKRGRPRLGVVGREITLLPDQWAWLGAQPGGASLALRNLVEAARRAEVDGAEVLQPHSAPRPAPTPVPTALAERATAQIRRPPLRPLPPALAELVPPDKHPVVRRALEVAFGTDRIDSAARVSSGAAGPAIVLRLTLAGTNRAHLMRLEGPPSLLRDTRRHYACWRIAAAADVAPRLVYADEEGGVAIGDWLHPLPPLPQPSRTDRIRTLLECLKRLHAAPLFPPCMSFGEVLDSLLDQCRGTGILAGDVIREHLSLYAGLAAAYRRLPPDTVSSHNDLNPSNVVFAGNRAWLIDWESAFAADRHIDLAALINFYAVNRYDEEMVLRIYFGSHLTNRDRARTFLMQQLNRLFYALVLLIGVAALRPQTRLTAAALATAPRFGEVRGELGSLATIEGRLKFGGIFLNEMKWNLQSPRYAESLRVLGAAQ